MSKTAYYPPWHEVLRHLFRVAYESYRFGRDSKLWRKVRKQVIARQNGTCYISGDECEILDVHHLEDAESNPGRALDPTNGVALRPDIHRRYHKENGGTRKPCTEAHFRKWAKKVRKEYR